MLKSCIGKLVKIAEEASQFRDLLEAQENATDSNLDRETVSEPPSHVFGRDEDKDRVISLLEEKPSISEPGSSTRPTLPITAIVGRSGVGKTTLAQYVCKQIENRFDLSVWLHITRKFKASDVIKNMITIIKAAKGTRHECNFDPSTPLQSLLTETKSILGSRKILLVLDDFWCDTPDFGEQWEMFISCLGSWSPESRILITTQSATVKLQAHIVNCTEVKTHNLQDLDEDHFFQLFMHHAWPGGCSTQKEKYEGIGRKIAAKLKGDPGAAKLLDRQMSEKIDLLHWEEVAEKDWFEDNMKARIWSYQQLPADLQRCFTFCSLFPKSTLIPIGFLISSWIAEGLIKPTHQEARVEDIGKKYLRELVSRYFVEQYENEGDKIYLHDLFHDLAQEVRGDDFLTIECTNSTKFLSGNIRIESIRHISLPASMMNKLKDKICLMKNLRSLCLQPDDMIPKEVLQEILENLGNLRLLSIYGSFDDLPNSFGNLKHLRYLNIGGSVPLKKFPNSICKLYHLQTLVVPSGESLPMNFCELISLRRLVTNQETMFHISDVGRLTSLQKLSQFVVNKKPGHELHQLEKMNQLRGKMCITGLENVVHIEDAITANLRMKKHLEGLKFEWNSKERTINDFQLLDTLQPHPKISILTIKRYGGIKLPTWFRQHNSLKHLTSLQLLECTKVEEISSIDESLPSCKSLILWRLKRLKRMPVLPQNLTTLEIVGIPWLIFFSEDDLSVKQERNKSILEDLNQTMESLKLNYIHLPEIVELLLRKFLEFVKERLETLPEITTTNLQYDNIVLELETFNAWNNDYSRDQLLDACIMCMRCLLETMFNASVKSKLVLPSSLTRLAVGSCNITNDVLSNCMQSLVFLSELILSTIYTITSLPPKEVLCALRNLQYLTIKECYLLRSLGGIGALTSLKELKLESCLNLSTSNEPLPSSLDKLQFVQCKNADIILAKSHLPVLRALVVVAVTIQKGVLLVGHLSSLEELSIFDWSGHLEGLRSLASLHSLKVDHCPQNYLASPVDKYLSPLKTVQVNDLAQLKLMLSDETISSIENLKIANFEGDSLEDGVFYLLTSLTYLGFNNCKITHLPTNMKNLASLQFMELKDCPNLCQLEDLPQNLHELDIRNCPTLMEKFKKGGPYRVRFKEGSTIVTFLIEEERKQSK